ncbi:hypothetical protein J3B02_002773, partial [Coemansia erecta]
MYRNSVLQLSKYLFVALFLYSASTEADLLGDAASNINQLVQPAHSAAQSFVQNIGSNIASVADNAGNAIASVATHAVQSLDNNQENKINSELSSFESSGKRLVPVSAGSAY